MSHSPTQKVIACHKRQSPTQSAARHTPSQPNTTLTAWHMLSQPNTDPHYLTRLYIRRHNPKHIVTTQHTHCHCPNKDPESPIQTLRFRHTPSQPNTDEFTADTYLPYHYIQRSNLSNSGTARHRKCQTTQKMSNVHRQ